MRELALKTLRKLDWLFVIVLTAIMMAVMMAFKSHLFLTDDNYTQFFPIIDKVYESFITKGRLPQIDFYQMKGMLIGDEVYYGQTNILLFVGWLLARYVFTFSDCIDVYAVICIVLGNLVWNQLLTRCDYSPKIRFVVIAMMTAVGVFFWFGYWYYIFNNYICVPLLLYGCYLIVTSEKPSAYIMTGIVLFLSLTMGNVQYTFYQYMVFAIAIIICSVISKNWKIIKKSIFNLLIAIVLSLPILLLLLKAGARRSQIVGSGFLTFPVGIIQQFVFSLLPYNWLMKIISGSDSLAFLTENSSNSHIFNGFFFISVIGFLLLWFYDVFKEELNTLFAEVKLKKRQYIFLSVFIVILLTALIHNVAMSIFLYVLIAFVIISYRGTKNNLVSYGTPDTNIILLFTKGVFIAIVFMIIMEMGRGYGIADLLSALPVIKRFNYLHKISLVVTPLMGVVAAYVLKRFGHKKMVLAIAICFVALGVYNNNHIAGSNTHPFYTDWFDEQCEELLQGETLIAEMQEMEMNVSDYRLLPFINDDDGNAYGDYPDAGLLSSNLPTYLELYELGGYERAYTPEGYDSTNALFPNKGFSYARTSSVSSYSFFDRCAEDSEYAKTAVDQMIANGTRYCIFNNDSPYMSDFEKFIRRDRRIKINRKIFMSNGTTVYELDGINPIFAQASINKDKSSIDEIVIQTGEVFEDDGIQSSFSYFENLQAYYIAADSGKRIDLMIEKDDQNNAVIKGNDMANKEIHIRYVDNKQSLILYYGMFGSFLALIFLGFCMFLNRKDVKLK